MKEIFILLIDDDADEHELFSAALETVCKGCTFLSARGADEALQVLDAIIPDFIFLDINMPAKDGFQCLSEIKRREE